MKRAQSDLVDAFLINVRKGLIAGREDSSGPVVIEHMVVALEAIKAGSDPDAALKITRSPGQPADPDNLLLALHIDQMRASGEKWSTIEIIANEYLVERGRAPVTEARLKALHKQQKAVIQQHKNITRLVEMTRRQKR